MLLRTEAFRSTQAVAAANPSIIGTPTVINNSTNPNTGGNASHTVTSDTDLIVVAVLMGGDGVDSNLSSVSSSLDGSFTVALDGTTSGNAGGASPGWAFAFLKPVNKGISHTITYVTSANCSYSGAIIFNIKDIDSVDPIGATISIANIADSADETRAITVETADCLLLSFGSSQGDDTDPFVALEGATLIATGDTGGGSTSSDAGYGYAYEIIATVASHNVRFTWASADGYGIAAIEVRTPT